MSAVDKTRLVIDVPPEVAHELKRAASGRGVTLRRFLLGERLDSLGRLRRYTPRKKRAA